MTRVRGRHVATALAILLWFASRADAQVGGIRDGSPRPRDVVVPVMQLQLLPWIYDHSIVDAREDLEDGNVRLELRLTETEAAELDRRLGIGGKPVREDWER